MQHLVSSIWHPTFVSFPQWMTFESILTPLHTHTHIVIYLYTHINIRVCFMVTALAITAIRTTLSLNLVSNRAQGRRWQPRWNNSILLVVVLLLVVLVGFLLDVYTVILSCWLVRLSLALPLYYIPLINSLRRFINFAKPKLRIHVRDSSNNDCSSTRGRTVSIIAPWIHDNQYTQEIRKLHAQTFI